MRSLSRHAAQAGFTLVEVLVALLIMAIVAALSWQGIDAIVRSRDISSQRLEQQLRLQSVIAQWEADLAEIQDSGIVPALQFDGASLRLTRRQAAGLQLVVWSLRGDSWTRWAGPAVTRGADLREAWLQSQQLLGNEAEQLRALSGIANWQLYYWRGNAWTNAQSSGDAAPATAATPTLATRQALPGGVRLVLAFTEGSGRVGALTRDLRLSPQGS
ncbi:MAG: type II secretion system protein J [Methylibium sp.]|uniref:General secretion pathway protein J n=1 Tax=Methylibium petroleiphilum (strain ATCC BAA-1232 / LMG 22953 / PM1) TaxID=420662 RepID=A2SKJ5_METPP|nr:prepilin-type N-terminal cleavage/methylation domain-containing protein [Methylibium petroleiphilum]ABM96084.1 general secretion pathway protein J [Methylibium petroleiphilum PM1]